MNKRGFTLLEVLIVALLILILVRIALPQYMVTLEKARSVEAIINIGNIRVALQRYWYENDGDLTGAMLPETGRGNLDINNPNDTKNRIYTYTISDLSGPNEECTYTITATRTVGDETYIIMWIQENKSRRKFYRSANLGGPEPPGTSQ